MFSRYLCKCLPRGAWLFLAFLYTAGASSSKDLHFIGFGPSTRSLSLSASVPKDLFNIAYTHFYFCISIDITISRNCSFRAMKRSHSKRDGLPLSLGIYEDRYRLNLNGIASRQVGFPSPPSLCDDERPSKIRRHGSKIMSVFRSLATTQNSRKSRRATLL